MRDALAAAGLVAASLLLCALALELGLRVFWSGHYLDVPKAYSQRHPTRGWENRRSVSVTYGEAEFRTTVTTNSLGLRSPELRSLAPGDRVRVLVLGDSFAYGVGVEDDATFSARLEALDPALEVLNAGVNGYATSHELLLLREVGLAVQPDLVLLAFFWNDVTEAWRTPSPPFTLQDGRLVDPPHGPDDPPASAWPDPNRRPWLHDSRARRFLKDRAHRARWRLRVALGIPVDEPTGLEAAERARAWELCFALLREMDRLVRGSGARFAIAVIPDQVQVYPELERTVLGIDEADIEVQAPLAAFAREEGIPFLDLLPPLRAARAADSETPLYYTMDRHLTAEGHRVVSEALGSGLRSLGLLRPARERAAAGQAP